MVIFLQNLLFILKFYQTIYQSVFIKIDLNFRQSLSTISYSARHFLCDYFILTSFCLITNFAADDMEYVIFQPKLRRSLSMFQ